MKFTYEEQLWLADKLREPKRGPQKMPEGYMDCLELVDRQELLIPTALGESRCYLTRPIGVAKNKALIINVHGGGFVQQHYDPNHALCAIYALELGCTVLDIDYRLAPEHPYPAAMNECYDVLQWAVSHADELGIDPQQIAAGGDSAGAVLCANMCMLAQEKGGAAPALLIMLYPAADMVPGDAFDGYSGPVENVDLSTLSARCAMYTHLYTGQDPKVTEDPHVSLNLASPELLKKFPETLMITAGLDPLRPGGEQFALKILESGSVVTLKCCLNSLHGFFVRCTGDEWYAARKLVMETISRKFGIAYTPWRVFGD